MKVPTKMLGKGRPDLALLSPEYRLNESPSEKEGKSAHRQWRLRSRSTCLNESPSEKEGKCNNGQAQAVVVRYASMKVPPKRKGNAAAERATCAFRPASMKVPPKRKGNQVPRTR